MAGSYADVPGPRMAYDRDGSVVLVHDGNTSPLNVTPTNMQTINDEADTSDYVLPANMVYVAVIFPQLRDIAGWGARFGASGFYSPQVSMNTTNGLDGTWSNLLPTVNMLLADDASFETGVGTWTPSVNGAPAARSTAQAADGAASLLMASSAAGIMEYKSGEYPISPNTQYTILGSFRAATLGRTCILEPYWVDASHTPITSGSGSGITDTTTGFLPAFATLTSPSNAAYIRLGAFVNNTGGANEQHYLDKVSLAPGSSTIWVPPNSVSNTAFDPAGASHRNNITAQAGNGVKAIRFNVIGLGADRTVYGVHLYGKITTGQTPDRLIFTDQSGNPLSGAFFDWGDVPQGSSADKLFAVKNISATKTATSIAVTVEALTDTTPSVPTEHLVSTDGSTFFSTVVLPSLAPGQSQNMTLRRVTPAAAPLSVWDCRVVAQASAYA